MGDRRRVQASMHSIRKIKIRTTRYKPTNPFIKVSKARRGRR